MARTPQEFRRAFGRRRHMLGKPQAAIAAAIDMDRVQYSQMEGGRYQAVQFIDLARLGDELQTSVDYLLLRTPDDPGTIPP